MGADATVGSRLWFTQRWDRFPGSLQQLDEFAGCGLTNGFFEVPLPLGPVSARLCLGFWPFLWPVWVSVSSRVLTFDRQFLLRLFVAGGLC